MNMLKTTCILVAAVCVAAVASVGLGDNIVPNPGFETGTTEGWEGNFAVTAGVSHTGLYSAELGELSLTFDAIPVSRIEKITFWLKHGSLDESSSFAYCSAWMETRTGDPLVGAVPLDPWTLDWRQQGIGLGTHPDCVVMGITIGGYGSYVDEVEIVLNAQQVPIDIMPGDADNTVDLHGGDPVLATILGGPLLNVYDVDVSSVSLDGIAPLSSGGAGPAATFHDVNGDSFLDLTFGFASADLSYPEGTKVAELYGLLLDGTEFFGTDSIQLVAPEPTSLALLALLALSLPKRGGPAAIRGRKR